MLSVFVKLIYKILSPPADGLTNAPGEVPETEKFPLGGSELLNLLPWKE